MSAYRELFTELVASEIDLWNRVDRALVAETGSTAAQLQALASIARLKGAARVQDVSDKLHITVGAASKLIDRLERDGLATRSPHPGDRRSMLIGLSETGEDALRESSAAMDSALEELLGDRLAPAEAEVLAGALRAIRRTPAAGVLA